MEHPCISALGSLGGRDGHITAFRIRLLVSMQIRREKLRKATKESQVKLLRLHYVNPLCISSPPRFYAGKTKKAP